MDRPSSKVLARRADRVRPGVIVSTVSEAAYDQTVVFIWDPLTLCGFRMDVRYSPSGRGAEAHELAIAKVRHPSNPLQVPFSGVPNTGPDFPRAIIGVDSLGRAWTDEIVRCLAEQAAGVA